MVPDGIAVTEFRLETENFHPCISAVHEMVGRPLTLFDLILAWATVKSLI